MSYGAQQHTPFWSPELYAVGGPSVGCVVPSVVVGATPVCILVGGAGA